MSRAKSVDNIVFSPHQLAESHLGVGLASFALYWGAIIGAMILLGMHNRFSLLAVPLLIIIYHGTHEGVHGTLVPRMNLPPKVHETLAFISATAGFALVGQNYLLMRWSHRIHHTTGRLAEENTIDGKSKDGSASGRLMYFATLCGFNCYFHELTGYLYVLIPSEFHILDRRFRPWSYPFRLYLVVQIAVFAATSWLIYVGGIYFIFCRILFALYWGLMQNVAHYGLEHGSLYAARTYRTNVVIEFLLFKAGMRHLEHHVFPGTPGYCLDDGRVQEQLVAKLGFAPKIKRGTAAYWHDVFRQLKGPHGTEVSPTEWRDA